MGHYFYINIHARGGGINGPLSPPPCFFLKCISTRDKTSSRGKLGCKLVAILYKYRKSAMHFYGHINMLYIFIVANGTTIPKHGQNPSVSAANALWTNAYEGKFKPTACYPIM